VRTGIALARALRLLHADDWDPKRLDWLLKDEATAAAILAGEPTAAIVQRWQKDLDLYKVRRRPFLLYE
jgi:hypothetical protein